MPAPQWAAGMQRIGPGLYVDGQNDMHVVPEEICRALGIPATPENLEMTAQVARATVLEAFPDAKVTEVDDAGIN